MVVGNSINESTTGVCGFSGTAFTSSPATQYCVQIGGASSHLLSNVTNGTTGQFLGANTGAAPTFQTISTGTGTFNQTQIILTSSQVKNLLATPIEVVPAQGANVYIIVIGCYGKLTYGTSVFTNSQRIGLYYKNGATYNVTGFSVTDTTQLAASSSQAFVGKSRNNIPFSIAIGDVANHSLVIMNEGASEITGNAGNDNTVTINVS